MNHDKEEDVLDENAKLNDKIQRIEEKYARSHWIRDGLLTLILVICIAIVVIVLVNSFSRTNQISKSDVRQTQLLCAAVENPRQYIVCREVGLPQRIGELK